MLDDSFKFDKNNQIRVRKSFKSGYKLKQKNKACNKFQIIDK